MTSENGKNVIVIGGGASGMAAAYAASLCGHRVTLLEKNEKLGKKIYITGKGRCNCTNASDIGTILKNVVSNPKFLYSALYTFSNEDLCTFLTEHGCPVKTERGNRVFPVSDHSSDVTRAWERALLKNGVRIRYHAEVTGLIFSENTDSGVCETLEPSLSSEMKSKDFTRENAASHRVVTGVRLKGEILYADHVIVATGGLSYPTTGSTGDGYGFAESAGHSIEPTAPSLVSLHVSEPWVRELSGLSLKNIRVSLAEDGKAPFYEDFGEMLFTLFGVSGPVILSASAVAAKRISAGKLLNLHIDLKPALSEAELDARILRDFSESMNKRFKNALDGLLPKSLIPVIVSLSGIPEEKPVNAITREERLALVSLLKGLPLTVTGTGGYAEAVITQGGISTREIDPSTMKSKKAGNLSFAGEVLDVDAMTGGYNLQIAWSTGYLAGLSV